MWKAIVGFFAKRLKKMIIPALKHEIQEALTPAFAKLIADAQDPDLKEMLEKTLPAIQKYVLTELDQFGQKLSEDSDR